MSDHDFERAGNLSQGYAGVLLPCFEVVRRVDEDNEVLISAFVEDLGNVDVSARHGECWVWVDWKEIGSHACKGVVDWLLFGS